MPDVLYVATMIAFFALMVAFVYWCEHLIGKDDAIDAPPADGEGDVDPDVEPSDPSSTVKTLEEVTA